MIRHPTLRQSNSGFAAVRWLVAAGLILAMVAAWHVWRRAGRDREQGVELVLAVKASPEIRPVYQALIARFEERNPGITVKLLEIPGTVFYQKVLVMLAGRTPPDVMWMGQSFGEYAERGAFLDVTDRIAAEVDTSDYLPEVLKWYSFEGRQYGLPHAVDQALISYNRELFLEAGVPLPTDDWTMDQFLAAAKALTIDKDGDGRIDQYGFYGRFPPELFGAQMLANDGSRAMCNSPEMVDWLEFRIKCRDVWKISPSSEEVKGAYSDEAALFNQRRVAILTQYSQGLKFMRERCTKVDWDIVGNPSNGKYRAHWASSAAILACADTRHPDEAWLLCKEFFSDHYQTVISSMALPPKVSVAKQAIAANTTKPHNIAALLRGAPALRPAPRIAHLSEYQQHFNQAEQKAMAKPQLATPQEAMAEAATAIDRAIAKWKKKEGRRQ
jgi:multiple sugar transport system substrate-binding protein